MNFDNIELRDLIRFISTLLGRNFLFDENVVKGKITILAPQSLTKEEVNRVFETVMSYFGFAIIETKEVTKIVKWTDAKSLAMNVIEEKEQPAVSPEDRPVTYIHHLDYLDATTLVGILRPLMSRDAYLTAISSTNSLIMVDNASNIQRLKEVMKILDVPVSKRLETIRVFNIQHTNASDLAKTLQTLIAAKKGATPREQIFISSFPSTNSIIISAPPEDLKEMERIIGEIDTYRPQVLVEAAIVEISTTKGLELGVEWLVGASSGKQGPATAGGFVQQGGSLMTVGGAIGSAVAGDASSATQAVAGVKTGLNIGILGETIRFMGKDYPSLAAFIRALSTVEDVNILSTPQILTLNNEEAEIIVGENRPYQTTTRLDAAGNPIYSYDYRDVGVKLKVKPSINKDGFVYLNIHQEVTKVSTGATATELITPTTLKRSTKTTVGVKDSQTIVISGLISDDTTGSKQGVPLLSALPIIGSLFGYKKSVNEKKNLLVFITPRIVYMPEQMEEITKKKKQEQEGLIKGKGIRGKESS
jgi:general secretion pathway protein D